MNTVYAIQGDTLDSIATRYFPNNPVQVLADLLELNPALETKESDELEILVLLVEKYEEINWNIATPDPIEAIKYRMEEMNLKQKDLIPYIGNKSKVSELLNRKISLSLTMVRNLSQALHIPVETLVKSI